MKRVFLISMFLITVSFAWYVNALYQGWQIIGRVDVAAIETSPAGLKALTAQLAQLPSVYPYTVVKKNGQRAQNIVRSLENFKTRIGTEDLLHKQTIDELLALNDEGLAIVSDAENLLRLVPASLLSTEQHQLLQQKKIVIAQTKTLLQNIKNAQYTLDYLVKNEASIVVLLQNQNEPRSTGGFIGSIILVEFQADGSIEHRFEDIYALDRKILLEAKTPAPEFFYGLDTTLSLKDANFWPDFPTSAEYVRQMLVAAGYPAPSIVIGTNLNTAHTILQLGGPITLAPWSMTLDQYNFDTVLQFLVEGKITGRYAVKEPVALFMQQVFAPDYLSNIDTAAIIPYDWKSFLAQKNIVAHSTEPKLQKIFDTGNVSGRVKKHPLSENFLHFDFVSIGANKSEKFLWTKFDHDSLIASDGTVINTLKVKRTHALGPNEIENQLGFETLPENIKNLMTDDLKWKLGAGQNRTILRVWVPENAELIDQKSPSGEVQLIAGKKFAPPKIDAQSLKKLSYLEIPLFVLPGESLETSVTYKTQIKRGSQNWRPYWLQLTGTPGRNQTKIYTSISLQGEGKFSAETFNLGRPVDLVDQDFRSVVEFD
jgi:hypothetical protein